MMGLAEARRLLNDIEGAEKILREAIGLQPGNWRPFQALGSLMFRLGRYDDAAEQFLKVIALDDWSLRGYSNLGTCYLLAGRFSDALPVFQRAISIEPNSTTYINMGLMHYYLGDYDEAVAAMRNAVNLQPGDHRSWMNLGDVLHVSGRRSEARGAFTKAQQFLRAALDVNPNEAPHLMDLGWTLAMLGNEQEALAVVARSQGLTPEDPYAWFTEALIRNELGETGATLDALQIAADTGFSRVLIGAEPHLANLASNARFREIADGS